ncbi:MAG: hypothetical protein ABIA74_05015 [bacterium]
MGNMIQAEEKEFENQNPNLQQDNGEQSNRNGNIVVNGIEIPVLNLTGLN